MRSKSYVGPVTSLAFLGDDLLAGHGSHLKLFTSNSSRSKLKLRWRKQIFKRERVQGIQFSPARAAADGLGATKPHVLLWGGKRFQILPQSVLMNQDLSVGYEDEISAPDWILHATFLESGNETVEIAIITAHNTILRYRHDLDTTLAQRFRFYPSPERCLLYSACITLDATADATDTLIALAGTVFGEVLLWRLDTSKSTIEKTSLSMRYLSHEGSVFGVSVSPDLTYAASCSDDRTIRLWEINEETADDRAPECREVKEPLAVGWGHQARIWGVRFLQSSDSNIRLISYSEDLTAKIWFCDLTRTKKSLDCAQTFKSLHSASGKSIWSLAVNPSGDLFVTGGADSGIASWRISNTSGTNDTNQHAQEEAPSKTSITEDVFDLADIFPPPSPPAGKKVVKEEPLKYVALGDHSFLLTTSSGWLRYCDLSMPIGKQWRSIGFWPQIIKSAAFGAGKLYSEDMCKNIVGLADNEGKLLFLQYDESGLETGTTEESRNWVQICDSRPCNILFTECSIGSSGIYAAVTSFKTDAPVKLLYLTTSEQGPIIQRTWSLCQPETFPFTTILVVEIQGRRICLAGSRHGALTVYLIKDEIDADAEIYPREVWRRVHDEDSVTSLSYQQAVSTPGANSGDTIYLDIVSTGRSGSCKFHRLSIDRTNTHFILSERNIVYPATLPRIKNYYNLRSPHDEKYHEILSGFRGRDFVLWNQTLGIEAASLDCEGGNRSWDFSFSHTGDTKNTGLFVFSKAKKCHVVRFVNITHNPLIQTPFHGRELKALAVSPALPDFPWQIIATGAEDTTIRFSYVDPESNELVPLTTRKSHTTGIQDLVWSSCGGWLFSSGSIEEVYCWKVNRNPPISTTADTNTDLAALKSLEHLNLDSNSKSSSAAIGVVLEEVCSVSTTSSPDLRVCGLDVATINGPKGHLGFLVGMARSDSSIRIEFYSILMKRFVTLVEGVYKTCCLLQVKFHVTASGGILMITAGTDGHVAGWDITASLNARGVVSASGTLCVEKHAAVSSARIPAKLQPEQQVLCRQLHQNSVKALILVEGANGNIILLTGGDDTAICVSRLAITSTEGQGISVEMTSKLVERAHASAVTTITALSVAGDFMEFISAGVDQQVKRWTAGIPDDMKNSSIEVVEDIYVAVPDVAATALLADQDGEAQKLLVGGVGVEILEL
ncbi:hypothetical protein ABW21_db0205047 [Orbilia brochopaga]|nr:hypothetical protein ABW21_db0205047 [Drechslerella brochopaga]